MQVLKIAGVSILALGLVLGIALPGLAAPDVAPLWDDDFQARIVKGKVLSVDEGKQQFVIQSGEEEVPISVDDNTKYHKLCVPGRIVALARHLREWRLQNQEETGALGWHQMGWRHQNQIPQPGNVDMPEPKPPRLKWLRPFGEESEFSDIAPGDRVAVWLAPGENSYLLAQRVLIIKPTTYARVSGTISVSSEEKTIIITPDDGGEAVSLDYNEGTVFILRGIIEVETGQYAHAIYDSDNMVAKRVIVYQLAE